MREFSVAVTEVSSRNTRTSFLAGEKSAETRLGATLNLVSKEAKASKWVPMARLPMVSPPGKPSSALPNLAKRGARNIMEERTFLVSSGGMTTLRIREGSIVRVEVPRPVIRQPIISRILTTAATSAIWGTLCKVTGELARRVAGSKAKIEFLLPEILAWPLRGMPPVTIYLAMRNRLYHPDKVYSEGDEEGYSRFCQTVVQICVLAGISGLFGI